MQHINFILRLNACYSNIMFWILRYLTIERHYFNDSIFQIHYSHTPMSKDWSMMYRALWDRGHEGATRISQITRRVAQSALTYPSGPCVECEICRITVGSSLFRYKSYTWDGAPASPQSDRKLRYRLSISVETLIVNCGRLINCSHLQPFITLF